MADSLDRLHPLEYFTKAGKLLASNNLNEASFIFYLGSLRYRYYNSVNPSYKESEDGALFASLNYAVGEPFYMFLKANVNNYISIVKKSIDWYSSHEYKFYVDSKSKEKYLSTAKDLNEMMANLEKNKDKYGETWAKERQDSEKNFDDRLKELDKQLNNAAQPTKQ
ncbi:hypothetical protein [Mucilaginibacter flavidus]|uniref:hypothetical protein n=1 Tax=Mucilaginibacter flavidus TaxID=2949309 RepID=UPI002091EECA|nr:hypothetical protein [Mucilaginibacter flavidus]MCO5948998.1 hypothetical protein [Mucilaginibacter flavidus]